jgi:hypothetical protein
MTAITVTDADIGATVAAGDGTLTGPVLVSAGCPFSATPR